MANTLSSCKTLLNEEAEYPERTVAEPYGVIREFIFEVILDLVCK